MHVYKPSRRHRKWWIEFKDHQNVTRRVPGYRSKEDSVRRGDRIMVLVGRKINGDPPPPELAGWITNLPEAVAGKLVSWDLLDRRRFAKHTPIYIPDEEEPDEAVPLKQEGGKWPTLLSEWRQTLIDDGNTPGHAHDQVAYVRRLLQSLSVAYPNEMQAHGFAGDVKAELAKRRRAGLSESGSNHYLQAVKQFGGWLSRTKRVLPANPVAELDPVKVSTSVRARRPLEVGEFQKLVKYLVDFDRYPKQRHEWAGYDRLMIYWTAVSTGFRENALRHLRRADFFLDNGEQSVRLPANLAKNGKEHHIRLPDQLAEKLRTYMEPKLPGAPAFPVPGENAVGETLRKDLKGAGVERCTEQGNIDFHAFRHTAITWWLDVHELHPRRVMELAQLSSLELVIRYSRRWRLTDHAYLERTPTFDLQSDEEQADVVTSA